MPLIDVTFPAGAVAPGAREPLVNDLTTALLRAERAPDAQFFRDITWVYLHELPAGDVYAGGRPVTAPTVRVDVTTPEGALSDRRRAELVGEATRVVREHTGIPEEESLRVWVLCHEVPEGSWGAAGQVVQFAALRAAAAGERERSAAGILS
jgi:phenylpyruvate tautomerase PptA (4-oxalocrotonate tautomerase family)